MEVQPRRSLLQLRRISYHNGDLQGTLKAYSDFQYVRNDLGNITSITMKDRSKQLVGYNAAGEVVKTEHLLDAAGTDRRRGGNFAWTYDGIGNRLSAARGGDSAGANLRASTYTPNALNQYDSITQPGAVDVTGRAPLADSVTVNGDPVVRQGGRFHREVTADNSGGPVWKEILVANGTESLDGFSLIPPATASPRGAPWARRSVTPMTSWPHLEACFEHGQIDFDNNCVENAIRPTRLGHKNWMFVGGKDTGWRSAVIYTLVEQVLTEPISIATSNGCLKN